MPKMNLKYDHVVAGIAYGPGDVEVPEYAVEVLKNKEQIKDRISKPKEPESRTGKG